MAGRWLNASPARGGCPWPAAPPSASPPRAPPRPARQGIAGGTGGVGAPTGRARCSTRVSGGRCAKRSAGSARPPSRTPVTLGAQVTEGGTPRRGRRGPPRTRPPGSTRTQLRGRTRAPRGRPAAPRAGLGKFTPDGRLRAGRQGNAAGFPAARRPPPASCCGEPGAPVGRPPRAHGVSADIAGVLPSHSSPLSVFRACDPLRATDPWKRSLDGTAELTMS